MLDLTVADGAFAVPALENAADGAPKLGHGIVREFNAEDFLDADFESFGQVFELVGGELGVALVTVGILDLFHHAVQLLADALAVCGFDALGLLHDDIGVHHDETAVGVIHETGVAGLLDKAGDGCGTKADIEDGVHHAGHGGTGAGAAAHEKGIVRVAELLAHDLLGSFEGVCYFCFEFGGVTATQPIVLGAAFGGDGEAGGNRHSQEVHLGQVGAFATQQLSHFAIALSVLAAKTIDSFFDFCHK